MHCTDNLLSWVRIVPCSPDILYVNVNVCWAVLSCALLSDHFYEIIPTCTCQRIQIGLDLHLLLHHQLHLDKEEMCQKSQRTPGSHYVEKGWNLMLWEILPIQYNQDALVKTIAGPEPDSWYFSLYINKHHTPLPWVKPVNWCLPAAEGSVSGVSARPWQRLAAIEGRACSVTHISMTSGSNEGMELWRCSSSASS